MGLIVEKLEKVVSLDGGIMRARCPACAETGGDRKGEHLRIYPDGKFGCCVHPGDREHRRRIFALAGERKPQEIRVKVAGPASSSKVVTGILGRLGRVFGSPNEQTAVGKSSDASDGGNKVQNGLAGVRTLRTGENESAEKTKVISRTPRTGIENSHAYAEEIVPEGDNNKSALKEFCKGVRSVREGGETLEPPMELKKEGGASSHAEKPERLPHLASDGTLVIPFTSPPRYHWWKLDGERMSVEQIHAEVLAKVASEQGKEIYGDGI